MAYKAVYKMETLTTDYSGNGNTLTNNNTVTQAPGKRGQSSSMVSASKQTLSVAQFVLGAVSGVTFSAQVKFDSLPTANYGPGIVLAGGGVSPYVSHFIHYVNYPGGTFHWDWNRSKHGVADSFLLTFNDNAVVTGKWYNIIGTTNGVNFAGLYLEGKLVASTTAVDVGSGNSGANSETAFKLGRENYTGDDNANRYIDGKIDEVIVDMDSCWSSQKVKTMYAAQSGRLQC